MENKNEEIENKIILGNFNFAMDKWANMVEIKHKGFIDAVPTMPFHNVDSGLRIYREGRTQISFSSTTMIVPLARIHDR